MKRKNSLTELAEHTGIEASRLETVLGAMARVFTETALEQDSIAVPGFGTFVAVKTDEREVTDSLTGKRMLFPPRIALTFRPSVILRKNLE